MDRLEIRVKLAPRSLLSFAAISGNAEGMSDLDSSLRRFETAVSRLEAAVDTLFAQAGHPALLKKELAAMVEDRAKLAGQLEQSLAREQELQVLADEASAALGTAIAEVQAALERPSREENM
jgi:hypothetical protein